MRRDRGFTLVEMVVTIAVIAILALVAAPRTFGPGPAAVEAATRVFAQDIRFAQRLATSKHKDCGVEVTGPTTYRIFDVTTSTPATDPLTREPMVVDLSESFPGVQFTGTGTLTFDPRRGVPTSGSTLAFTLGGRTVAVASQTGAVTR